MRSMNGKAVDDNADKNTAIAAATETDEIWLQNKEKQDLLKRTQRDHSVLQQSQSRGRGFAALLQLSKDFPDVNFTDNTSPYRGKGVNNISISPNILQQMETDPVKRREYEALINGCSNLQKSLNGKSTITGKKIAAHGFIIDANGGLSSWSITRADNKETKSSIFLPQNDKPNWLTKILEDPALF